MVELFILIIIVFNYVTPFEGICKLSKGEKKILDDYKHAQIKLTNDTEDLIGDIGATQNENGEFSTMSVLGDLDNKSSDKKDEDKDFTDVNLDDLYND